MDRFAWIIGVLFFLCGGVLMLIAMQMPDDLSEIRIKHHKLYSRPLSEIDIQGHIDHAPAVACPAVFDAPHGELRFCL